MQRNEEKRGKRVARRNFVALLTGALCLVDLTGGAASAAPSPTAGEVDVYRDGYGVPHIYAANEPDGFHALGHVQAEDSAENILIMALVMEGRSAAAFGTAALPWSGPAPEADKEALRWRVAEQGRAAYAALPPHLKAQLEAYTDGFNAYLDQHPEKKPDWAPRLEPWHSLTWPQVVLMFFNVGDGLRECARDGAKLASATWTADQRGASNAWMIGPPRTAGGKTFLLSDPHGDIPIPGNPFYEYRMKAGALDVTGFGFGPVPALVHSPKVAWGLTTGGPDVSDCYRLRTRGNQYSLNGRWQDYDVRKHEVAIAGGAAQSVQYRYARINGAPAPIIGEKDGYAYAVATPYWGRVGELLIQFDAMLRAEDAAGVLKAAEVQGMFPQNLLIADHKGSLIYLRGGRTPIRSPGIDPSRALDGDDPASQWRGIHKIEDLVLVRNPRTAYLQNNNTRPDNITKGAPLVRTADYPAYIWNDDPLFRYMDRANRVNEVLDAASGFTVADAERLSLDEKWFGTENWTALLGKAVKAHPETVKGFDREARRLLKRLQRFDGVADQKSVAALNHHAWRSALWADYGKNNRKGLEEALVGPGSPSDEALTAALAAVPAAVARLRERLGSIDRPLGDWFRIGRSKDRHYPVGGGVALELDNYGICPSLQDPAYICTVTPRAFVLSTKTTDGRPFVTHGSRALRLVALGRDFASYSIHNYGQSDDPDSPHWDDQVRALTSGDRLKRIPFTPAELARETRSHQRLVVKRQD